MLGGHEGEGLVVEHEAQVAGSRSADVGSVGQKMDHKIVSFRVVMACILCAFLCAPCVWWAGAGWSGGVL